MYFDEGSGRPEYRAGYLGGKRAYSTTPCDSILFHETLPSPLLVEKPLKRRDVSCAFTYLHIPRFSDI
jgi:hypothetical protein